MDQIYWTYKSLTRTLGPEKHVLPKIFSQSSGCNVLDNLPTIKKPEEDVEKAFGGAKVLSDYFKQI